MINQYVPPNYLDGGQLYLVHCHFCHKDNWVPMVATGVCAWCKWPDVLPEEPPRAVGEEVENLHIGGLLKCTVHTWRKAIREKLISLQEGTEIICPYCHQRIIRDAKGVWRWIKDT